MGWTRKIVKVGNSLGVRIPNQVFRKTSLKEGDHIQVDIDDDDRIIVQKCDDCE